MSTISQSIWRDSSFNVPMCIIPFFPGHQNMMLLVWISLIPLSTFSCPFLHIVLVSPPLPPFFHFTPLLFSFPLSYPSTSCLFPLFCLTNPFLSLASSSTTLRTFPLSALSCRFLQNVSLCTFFSIHPPISLPSWIC
jgi:hypothetical protein